MPPPTTRAEFEHNVYLLIDELERNADNEKYIANRMWALGDSLRHLKYLPNRRVELPTIDEKIRLHANSMDWLKQLAPVLKRKQNEEGADNREFGE